MPTLTPPSTASTTGTAGTTGTEADRPGLRARVRRISRSATLAIVLGLAAGATLLTTALPASAATPTHAFNLARTQFVQGTDCIVTVGTDYNLPNAWPGTATQVKCASPHTISVYSVLEFVYRGSWRYWTTPVYTYPDVFQTPPVYSDFKSRAYCIGNTNWVVYSYVYVDGVYHGVYANKKVANWTACTHS